MRLVPADEARRIAVRAQLLDGSATSYVLPILVGDRLVGRIEPRFDRTTKTLEVLGAWGDTFRVDETLACLTTWLGAQARQ